MKKITLIVFIFLLILAINSVGIYYMKLLSRNKATYGMIDGNVVCTYINTDSEMFVSGMQMGDKILKIDNIDVINKHFMYNRIIEKTKPGTKLQYTILRDQDTLNLQVVMEPFYSNFQLWEYVIASILCALLSAAAMLSFPASRTMISVYNIFNLLAVMIVYFHVPFGNPILYITLIISSYLLLQFLTDFSYLYLIKGKKRHLFVILNLLSAVATLHWIIRYIIWVIGMTEELYIPLMNAMKLYQLMAAITILSCSIIIIYKIMKISSSYMPKVYTTTTAFILIFMLPYPLFYSLPLVFGKKELIPFDIFFQSYILLLILLLFYKNNIKRIFL